ncbi:MAG: DUF4386 family protein [Archangiaceae bacterium]|nr:DUF4386 family protein [Archangiaceae bacterium]
MATTADDAFRPLYRLGAWAAVLTVVLVPVQGAIFALHPPPATVLGHFASLHEQPLLGLANLDLLYLVTMLLPVLVNVAVYAALRRVSPAWMLLSLVLAMLSTAIYFGSGAAFEMLTLSNRYYAAGTDAERAIFQAAGEAVLARYQGTAYDVSYVLGAFPSVLVAWVMLRSAVFSRATAWFGLATGVMMVLPPTVGLAGMVLAFASLVPLAVWLVLVARRLFQLARPT